LLGSLKNSPTAESVSLASLNNFTVDENQATGDSRYPLGNESEAVHKLTQRLSTRVTHCSPVETSKNTEALKNQEPLNFPYHLTQKFHP
jgi:hypothetical protein